MKKSLASFCTGAIVTGVVLSVVTAPDYEKAHKNELELKRIKGELSDTEDELQRSKSLLSRAFNHEPMDDVAVFSTLVTATGYSAVEEECNEEPWITASGTPSRVGAIAISRDLEDELGLRMGQMVIVDGMGLFRIDDRMNERWTRRIDILHGNAEAARLFGKKEVKLRWVK